LGAELVLIGDESPLGHQFVAGFGGVGAFLRYHSEFIGVAHSFDDELKEELDEKNSESDEEYTW